MTTTDTLWHPNTQHGLLPDSIEIETAKGAYLYTKDGKKIIDAIASWWVITHGHGHPYIIEAVQKQAEKLEQVIFAGFTHAPAEQLAEKLIAITPKELCHIFYSDSGSTAVEVAIKMAVGFWAQTKGARTKILALEGGYHGDTFGTMATGSPSPYNRTYRPFLFDVAHIPLPQAGQEQESFTALEQYLKAHGHKTAAFLFEPLIQGAGGMRIYSPEALQTLCEMCRKYDILLIADEVMTGFGRTGTMFACEQAGITPDLMALSKGLTAGFLPMGATLATREIYEAFYSQDRGKQFFHSTSFTGNALACAAANASLEIWEKEPVMEKIKTIANCHEQAEIRFAKNPNLENIRSLGTILAMDIKTDETGYLSNLQPQLYRSLLSQNVLLRPIGNTVYILPPYCIIESDMEKIYAAVEQTVNAINEE